MTVYRLSTERDPAFFVIIASMQLLQRIGEYPEARGIEVMHDSSYAMWGLFAPALKCPKCSPDGPLEMYSRAFFQNAEYPAVSISGRNGCRCE
eukprot:CAMPEP_0118715064 /NCGR_PEP_ID=MMETSP0800-20121206/26631_1 /TAXON_ID=210618 ORGANISM="Striatella unipunctata, Strain CCMP2910" /NCGR_SAMPLE_ID=MMETSP0800 /ASSEMBLY_ACC=CAM_ASM_000638 /LENGTH=92 /DNA_ID=CAMNT_0006621119 /DNA_START=376 /DNA_END=651 /DNA_ORIENTATION=-